MNDTVDIEKSWEILSFAITEIVNKNASKLSFEQLYRKCYHLVLRKSGEDLYLKVKNQLVDHLLEKRLELVAYIFKVLKQNAETIDYSNIKFSEEILSKVSQEWEEHCLCMRMISDVLMYLDRVYLKESSLPSTYEVGIKLFKECVIQYHDDEVVNILNHILMDGIASNRQGRLVDKFLIKSIIKMYEQLPEDGEENYYLKNFEPFFMKRSYGYYSKLSNELLKSTNGIKYITQVNEIIIEEENMSVIYLPKVTFPKLIQLLDNVLISDNIEKVIGFSDQGFKFWVDNDQYTELNLLYNLVLRIDSTHSVIQASLKKLVAEEGNGLEEKATATVTVTNTKPGKKRSQKESLTGFAVQWVENILVYKEKMDNILLKGFNNDPHLLAALGSGLMEFINKNPKASEYLSLYIDSKIKKSSRYKTDEECEVILDKAVMLFQYIKDKDLFEKYYKNHLTRRLLQQKYLSMDVERSMIAKLRQEQGALYTSKMEGMFRDMKGSKDVSEEFNDKVHDGKKISLSANVLTTTFWPLTPNTGLNVVFPLVIQELKDNFEKFYVGKHRGRNLIWAPGFGSLDIRTKFKERIYEINLPTYAAIVMLLFEDHEFLTFQELLEMTKIPEIDLIRHLQSISVAPRTRLLRKSPMSKDIKILDKFSINENFESSSSKVKVLTISLTNKAENDAERKETMNLINNSRKHEVDAAIVRIMKSRKTINHNELITEIIKQLASRFRPSPQFIKLRIENLLEREYIARSLEDKGVYTYLA